VPIGLLCAIISATRIWTASSLDNIYPDSQPPPGAAPHVRLYAAQGEYESFQICIRSSRRDIENVEVVPEPLAKAIDSPEIRNVGYLAVPEPSPRACGGQTAQPDPLHPFEPFFLEKDTTAALWVTYTIPRDCRAGIYQGRLGLRLAGRARQYVRVTIEVFDFQIPEFPSITVTGRLSAERIRTFNEVADDTLGEWRPFYDALAPWRIAFNTALEFPLAPGDSEPYLEHLLYAARRAHAPVIFAGMGGRLADALARESSLDTLQAVHEALAGTDWSRRICAEPMPMLPRSHWVEVRDRYEPFFEQAPSIRRLFQGVPHPQTEQLAEIWVMPLQFFDPIAVQRLRTGMSLSAELPYPLDTVRASSSAQIPTQDMPYAAAPEDACDGSLYTAWTSSNVPRPGAPEWLEFRLQAPATTNQIRIGWRAGHEAVEPTVEISSDGTRWTLSRVTWRAHLSDRRFAPSWSEGLFDRERSFIGIRFHFTDTLDKVPVSITEVELGRPPDPETIAYFSGGAQVWLDASSVQFPSFCADAHPVEARLSPWLCWGHELDGLFGIPLNVWPDSWRLLNSARPEIWPASGGAGDSFLLYPAPGTLVPSLRLYRLRDGLEDIEYLRAAAEAGVSSVVVRPESMAVCRWEQYAGNLPPKVLKATRDELLGLRTALGRAITETARSR
ncbi:MAG TPA: DUF6067 family protein, partial [Candidatus Hydrogenedentes bacterium]|nr:DUF6067 family protein [Candidatus Hydrogenedentota bacterium]